MSDKPIKSNSKLQQREHNHSYADKRGLLLRLIIFMAWVAIVGLFISQVASTLSNSKPIVPNTDDSIVREDE